MKELTLPDYQELSQALNKTVLKLPPSEAHGLICGVLASPSGSKVAWEEVVIGEQGSAEVQLVLQRLYEASAKQLEEFLFEFQMVLPEDAEALPVRAEALTLWCQGYLTGLKLANVQLSGRAAGEATDAINDLVEIAKMNYEVVVANEEDEVAYVELVEYVRMAVILIYQDIHEASAPKKATRSAKHLH
jgi:uncharacterized protein YgfB (UPF0149 family)